MRRNYFIIFKRDIIAVMNINQPGLFSMSAELENLFDSFNIVRLSLLISDYFRLHFGVESTQKRHLKLFSHHHSKSP